MSAQSYYIPDSSKLPITMALVAVSLAAGAGILITSQATVFGGLLLATGFLGFFAVLFYWFNQVYIESQQNLYNDMLHRSFIWGMVWFICSEVFFFATFFGTLFYMRFWVVPWLGGEGDKGLSNILWDGFQAAWPVVSNPDNTKFVAPEQTMAFPGFSHLLTWLPLWNTILLISSSVTCTIAHHGVEHSDRKKTLIWLGATVALGSIFLIVQAYEYVHAYLDLGLTLNSGIYGSTFFILTGFHGAHVTLGTIMLAVILYRCYKDHFTPQNHFGFKATAWYWHFVDVVWVLLFVFVYII